MTETEAEAEAGVETQQRRRKKARLIVRLGSLLVAHSVLVSVVCCSAGIVALLLLPALAKTTYISENALMPGSANPLFSSQDVSEANRFIRDIFTKTAGASDAGSEISKLIAQHMEGVGAEVYYHKFLPSSKQFHPVYFFSSVPNQKMVKQKNSSSAPFGVNSVGIIRAPRGDGKEAIVLVTPYNSRKLETNEALSLGLAFSVFSHFSRVTWLAKDIVWLAADSQFGEYTSVAAWLKEYHNPVFSKFERDVKMCSDSSICRELDANEFHGKVFRRGGTMAAGLVLKAVENKGRGGDDSLAIYAEASNGQMPNLDLINIVHYLAVHRQGFHVEVGILRSLLQSGWLRLVGETLQRVSKLIKTFNPKANFDISVTDYLEGTATLASSIYNQAIGVPTGPHGAFRDYQIDAITLEFSPGRYIHNEYMQSSFILRGGRLIEGTVRSVNNLLEKFHQSFFLYFLTAPNKFVSVGVYMIGFALLIAPLPIVAVAVCSIGSKPSDSIDSYRQESSTPKALEADLGGSWRWLHAARAVFVVHLWAIVVALLPYLLSQCSHISSSDSMLSWAVVSVSILFALYLIAGSPYSNARDGDWRMLKAGLVAYVLIGLILMSIVNFATAQIGGMILVPLSLLVQPLRNRTQAAFSPRLLLSFLNVALTVCAFPPATFLMMKGFSMGLGRIDIGIFWELAEYLWTWNSATYLYIVLIHLPCWVLCLQTLLHP